tara:strand:+ start:427 stop:1206 length:780 start_codon:yes stop_codon:yes gene_type:complete
MTINNSILNNSKLKFHPNQKFCIFSANDFLNKDFYNNVDKTFPKFTEFFEKQKKLGKKQFIVQEEYEIFQNFLENSVTHKKLYDFLHSKYFFNLIKNKLYAKFFLSQSNLLRKIRYFRPYKLISKNDKKSIFDIFFSKVRINIIYMYMIDQAYLGPHSDSQRKLCSLMIYFPEKNNLEDREIGTQFWDSKIRNSSNIRIDEKNLSIFLSKSKKILKEPFEKNKLVGFIRNDYSWHSVEKVNLPDNYLRKMIIINFLYEN